MKTIKAGDKYILHSKNGFDYDIEVVNVNINRPPNEIYAIDMWLGDICISDPDIIFVGEDFLDICEAV